MSICPNKNLPEWKNLEKTYGREGAFVLFDRAGEKIPGSIEARDMINRQDIVVREADDYTIYKDSYKIDDIIKKAVNTNTNKYKAIQSNLLAQRDQYYNRLSRLRDRRRATKDKEEVEKISAKILEVNELISNVDTQLEQLNAVDQIEEIKVLGDQAVDRVNTILSKDRLTEDDIQEADRLISLWSAIGDFNVDTVNGNPVFDDEDMQSDALKYGYTDEAGVYHKGFSSFKEEMDKASLILAKIKADFVVTFVRNQLNSNDITEEEVLSAINDVSWLKSQVLDLARVPDKMVQAVAKAMSIANYKVRRESDERFKRLDELLKAAKKDLDEDPFIFRQLRNNGRETGNLIFRFTQDYFDAAKQKLRKALSSRSATRWTEYTDWLKDNVIFFDVRKLFNEDGDALDTEEARAHKQELVDILGQKGFDYYYDMQTTKVARYIELRNAFKAQAAKESDNADADLASWEATHSPFIALDLLDNDELTRPPKYAVYVPRRINKSTGKATGWYDKKFEKVESNAALYDLYTYMIETLKEIRQMVPESYRRNLQINSMPAIRNSLITEFFSRGNKLGAAGILDTIIEHTRSNVWSVNTDEEINPKTGRSRKGIRPTFATVAAAQIEDELRLKIVEYKLKNKEDPPTTTVREWKEEIEDRVSKEKSWDLEKVFKLYLTQAIAYKHKAAVQSTLDIAYAAFGDRLQIETDANGNPKRDIRGNIKTSKGIDNIAKMMEYNLDVFFGKPKSSKGATITRSLSPREKVELRNLQQLLQDNQLSFEDGTIEEDEYKENKQQLENSINKLGGVITLEDIGGASLRYTQLVGMGFNYLAGIINIATGLFENSSLASDSRLFSGKQLAKAYKNVIYSILGRNFSGKTGEKIRNINKKFNITKEAVNELYNVNSFFKRKAKWLDPYIISERTEYINQMSLAIAYLSKRVAYKPDGSETTCYDALDDDGNIKDGYRLDKNKSNEEASLDVEAAITQLIKKAHGNYDPDSPILAKSTLLGKILLQFRSWMPEMYERRFGKEMTDEILGITTKGRYRSYAALFKASTDADGVVYSKMDNLLFAIKQLGRKMLFLSTKFDQRLNPVDAANMRANLMELHVLLGLILLNLTLKAALPDDDEDRRTFFVLLNLGYRMQSDIVLYTNPLEFEKLSKNLLPIMASASNIGNWLKSVGNALADNDEEQWARVLKNTAKNTPIVSQIVRGYTYGEQLLSR